MRVRSIVVGVGVSWEGSIMLVLVSVEQIPLCWGDEGVLVTEPSGVRSVVSPSISSRSRINSALPISSPEPIESRDEFSEREFVVSLRA
jgi:hypothetical protein